jgi:hypothetical protein
LGTVSLPIIMLTSIKPFVEGKDFIRAESGCWLWQRHRTASGYGMLYYDGKMRSAHRVSFFVYRRPIPVGLCVCHSCDNPACVNPDHLWLGTQKENLQDASRKGHMLGSQSPHPTLQGACNPQAKLNNRQVSVIRRARTLGVSCRFLATCFPVSHHTISEITRRVAWKNI